MERELKRALYDLNYKTAFTSKTKFLKHFEKKYPRKELLEWIKKQPIFSRFGVARKRFSRQPIISHSKFDTIFLDYADFSKFKKDNKNYRYLAVFVCALTRFVFIAKLKTRTPEELIENLKKMFKIGLKPKKSYFVDLAGEFKSRKLKKFLQENNVELWFSQNEVKSSLSERYILEIKRRLFRAFSHYGNEKWITIVDKVVDSLNKTKSKNLKMRPIDIVTKSDMRQAFINLHQKRVGIPAPESDLKVGDTLRISHLRKVFAKSYLQGFTEERFTITKVVPREGQNLYHVQGESDKEPVKGRMYKIETLQSKQ
jgi:hypothetical protein